jgi:hypothetical protein
MNRRALLAALALSALALPAAAQDTGKHKKGGGDSFIQLDTLTATIVRPDGHRGVMTVEVGIDVPDAGLHARAAQSTPLLRAAYGDVLRGYAGGLGPTTLPNADYLSLRLQQATDRTLGRPGARLLIGNILVN